MSRFIASVGPLETAPPVVKWLSSSGRQARKVRPRRATSGTGAGRAGGGDCGRGASQSSGGDPFGAATATLEVVGGVGGHEVLVDRPGRGDLAVRVPGGQSAAQPGPGPVAEAVVASAQQPSGAVERVVGVSA